MFLNEKWYRNDTLCATEKAEEASMTCLMFIICYTRRVKLVDKYNHYNLTLWSEIFSHMKKFAQ